MDTWLCFHGHVALGKWNIHIIDGYYFKTLDEAWQYVQAVDGRIYRDRFERYLMNRRRFINQHVLGYVESEDHCAERY